MAFYERDAGGNLIPISDVPEGAIAVIEMYDEQAIVHRMTTGIASEAFIYHYPIKTATGVKEIIGISTDGADEIARMLCNIEVLPDIRVDKDSDPDYIYVMLRAKNLIRNVTLLGTGRACKYQLGKGNLPDHDRLNEWAFVSSISKAQRNAILRHTPEEVIIGIINSWSKTGKGKTLKPPSLAIDETPPGPSAVVTPPAPAAAPALAATATVATQVAEQQERLKKLRMQVHNKFQTDLGIGVEKRRDILRKEFSVESLTDLNEPQLKDCLVLVEDMIAQKTVAPPSKPVPAVSKTVELGFESTDEQGRLRGRLYTVLTSPDQLGLRNEEAKKFVTDRGFASTIDVPKVRLLEMITEADELVRIKQAPPVSEELPPDKIPF